MLLATSNAQGELSALERGMHALRSGMEVKAYAESVGRKRTTVHDEVYAAEVAEAVPHMRNEISDYYRHLTAIHAAPYWLWPHLAPAMLQKHWTVEQILTAVARLRKA